MAGKYALWGENHVNKLPIKKLSKFNNSLKIIQKVELLKSSLLCIRWKQF